MKLPDDLKHASGGEHVDELAHDVLKLAHEAIERFPDVKRRHMFIAGGAAISSALIVAAGVAVARRIKAGARPEDAVQEVTEEEIAGLRLVAREPYRPGQSRPANEAPEGATTDEPEGTAASSAGSPAAADDTPPAVPATGTVTDTDEGVDVDASTGAPPIARDAAGA